MTQILKHSGRRAGTTKMFGWLRDSPHWINAAIIPVAAAAVGAVARGVASGAAFACGVESSFNISDKSICNKSCKS